MKIRKAKPEDAKRCLEIAKDEADVEGYSGLSLADFRRAATDKKCIFLVAEEKEIIGFVVGFLTPTLTTEAFLVETHIYLPHRKRGLGTALIQAFVDVAKKAGVKSILAYVGKTDEPGLATYKKNGFVATSQSWLEMEKKL